MSARRQVPGDDSVAGPALAPSPTAPELSVPFNNPRELQHIHRYGADADVIASQSCASKYGRRSPGCWGGLGSRVGAQRRRPRSSEVSARTDRPKTCDKRHYLSAASSSRRISVLRASVNYPGSRICVDELQFHYFRDAEDLTQDSLLPGSTS